MATEEQPVQNRKGDGVSLGRSSPERGIGRGGAIPCSIIIFENRETGGYACSTAFYMNKFLKKIRNFKKMEKKNYKTVMI